MRTFVGWALIFTMLSAPLAAQPAADQKHAEKVRSRAAYALEHRCDVTVETVDHRQLQGLVSETQADHFVLVLQGRTTTLTYAEVDRITWRQHMPRPVVAALTGIAVAGVLYAVVHLLLAKNG
jgi:hypothetical protein